MASSRSIERALLLIAALSCACAHAQTSRVRGTVVSLQADVLTVRDAARTQEVKIGEKTEIVFAKPMSVAEIRPGDFLAITSVKASDGTLTAYEVRRFPKPLNPGHRPFDGRDDQTMTNATVTAMVQSANGPELTMSYEGGAQKIVLPEKASISTLVPGSRGQLMPGAPVNLTMDAAGLAQRIQVGPKP
jgi:hypothetical protein